MGTDDMKLRELRDKIAIAGIGLSRFGKLPGVSAMGFASRRPSARWKTVASPATTSTACWC